LALPLEPLLLLWLSIQQKVRYHRGESRRATSSLSSTDFADVPGQSPTSARYVGLAKRVATFRSVVNRSFAELPLNNEVSGFQEVKRWSEDEEVTATRTGDAKLAVICGVYFAGR
jgi:hypothetical protein